MDAVDEDALAAQTLAIYEREGPKFDAQRPRALFERVWLDRLTDRSPDGGSVLDVGCGAGEPIAAQFINAGYRLTGVDGAASMV
ncbi:MAG: SAM-dependent methyltransferase, partial [Pseudomonadota bacterium]